MGRFETKGEPVVLSFSRESAPQTAEAPGFMGWHGEAGGFLMHFETFEKGGDFRSLYRDLPGGHCECPHWGYLFSGSLILHYEDRRHEVRPGEAYYIAPGHTAEIADGTELLEFSPALDYNRTLDVVMGERRRPEDG